MGRDQKRRLEQTRRLAQLPCSKRSGCPSGVEVAESVTPVLDLQQLVLYALVPLYSDEQVDRAFAVKGDNG